MSEQTKKLANYWRELSDYDMKTAEYMLQTKSSIDLPWKDIAGFRNKAVHDYFEVGLDVVWNTIIADIPILKSKLQKLT